jgi:hypothetical protein
MNHAADLRLLVLPSWGSIEMFRLVPRVGYSRSPARSSRYSGIPTTRSAVAPLDVRIAGVQIDRIAWNSPRCRV